MFFPVHTQTQKGIRFNHNYKDNERKLKNYVFKITPEIHLAASVTDRFTFVL